MTETKSQTLRRLIADDRILAAPGCWDALTALMIEQAGFGCAYLSGASIAYTRLGRSDVGLTDLNDVLDVASHITDRVGIPLIVDIDTGYGNALNVQKTVRLLERADVSAMQLEDQSSPKRCGHLADKALIPPTEMAGKIRAALDARRSDDTVIIARTDAISVEGFDAAVERGHLYVEAGCDMLFIEAPESEAQLERISAEFGDSVPLMANMVEGGKTPIQSREVLESLGFSLMIHPGALARFFARQAAGFLSALREDGSTLTLKGEMLSFDQLNAVIGTPELLENGRYYDG